MPSRSVLIVETESTIARLESALLRMSGFEPVMAGDGAGGLSILETQSFAAIVIGWPVRVGNRAFLEELIERFPAFVPLSVLVTSRLHDHRGLLRAAEAGVFAIVAKPFDVDVLSRVVSECVSSQGAHRETQWIGMPPPSIASESSHSPRPEQ
jgi:DNA-binding response OmpR family regulator